MLRRIAGSSTSTSRDNGRAHSSTRAPAPSRIKSRPASRGIHSKFPFSPRCVGRHTRRGSPSAAARTRRTVSTLTPTASTGMKRNPSASGNAPIPACTELARPCAHRGFSTTRNPSGNSPRMLPMSAPSTTATPSHPPARNTAACAAANGTPSAPLNNAFALPIRRDAPAANTMPTVFIPPRQAPPRFATTRR